jgi:hypothetical protein
MRVISTISVLSKRIEERFLDADLAVCCHELLQVSQKAKHRASWIGRPIITLRAAAAVGIAMMLMALVAMLTRLELSARPLDVVVFVNLLEAGINTIVLLAATVFFLVALETRIKRGRSLGTIDELRSLAHVIDMHHLTKDPDRLLLNGGRTQSSPSAELGIFEMSRYLDYCCEMLSRIGKIAAIYGVHGRDDAALQAVNDVERLTTGLSQKIFQKIMILHGVAGSSALRLTEASERDAA